ncbi:hypothetical protein HYH03_016611 [Edaphochlamys debaryana]|uniref:Uncharacterized protein n=1 Tax=Edaphochlamys debaryana TaxID=47281 RepID=A0A835XPA9_9CHLO|nr:hypothetical protein HYH03_016611 [Edaphochlamys debaryana]|eukprot:KAG2484565.1 hypothetical protein HYH03_016611 [Edaphochlamys debaryana]
MRPENKDVPDDKEWRLLLDFHCVLTYTQHLEKQLTGGPGPGRGRGNPGGNGGPRGSGRRGVVYAGGGSNQLANILVGVTYLREALGSRLPVEVIYYGEAEVNPAIAKLFDDPKLQPVALVDSALTPYPSHQRPCEIKSFVSKVWALYAGTSFDEVLLMDADNYPLVPPEEMFEMEQYKQNGHVFWPDFWHSAWIDGSMYEMFGSKPPWHNNPTHRVTESGQVLFDRRRLPLVLEWLWYLNSHSAFVYKKMHGDKDSFKLAFYLAGMLQNFTQVPVFNSMALKWLPPENAYLLQSVIQYSWKGEPLFFHQTKFFPTVARDRSTNRTQLDWLSPPAHQDRANTLFKPHSYALWRNQTDQQAYKRCGYQPGPGKTVFDIMQACGWKQDDRSIPTPVFPPSWLPTASARIDALTATFFRLRDQLLEATSAKWCPQLSGFTLHTGVDRFGEDLRWVSALGEAHSECRKDPECKAFNRDGWLKRKRSPRSKAETNCLWVKDKNRSKGEEEDTDD